MCFLDRVRGWNWLMSICGPQAVILIPFLHSKVQNESKSKRVLACQCSNNMPGQIVLISVVLPDTVACSVLGKVTFRRYKYLFVVEKLQHAGRSSSVR